MDAPLTPHRLERDAKADEITNVERLRECFHALSIDTSPLNSFKWTITNNRLPEFIEVRTALLASILSDLEALTAQRDALKAAAEVAIDTFVRLSDLLTDDEDLTDVECRIEELRAALALCDQKPAVPTSPEGLTP